MRLPSESSHYSLAVDYGRYVGRRLRRAKLLALGADVEKVNAAVLAAGRAWEDLAGPIQDAIADRDAIDDELDDAAIEARANLAGRSASAVREPPYTLIFSQGIAYYTAAPLDEETKRYGELRDRLDANLPAGDEVRVKTVAVIEPNLGAFDQSVKALNQARTAQAIARTTLDAGREGWNKQMEKVYGALVADLGKARADRFFPRVRDRKAQGAPT